MRAEGRRGGTCGHRAFFKRRQGGWGNLLPLCVAEVGRRRIAARCHLEGWIMTLLGNSHNREVLVRPLAKGTFGPVAPRRASVGVRPNGVDRILCHQCASDGGLTEKGFPGDCRSHCEEVRELRPPCYLRVWCRLLTDGQHECCTLAASSLIF
jgi:hypothetical protein